MADVAEVIEEVPQVEKEIEKTDKVEKKVVEVDAEDKSNDSPAEEPKENGSSEKNGDAKESNGVEDTHAPKRKSGAGDGTDGTVEDTPGKKAKVVVEPESEESNSTNGSAEVVA